MAASRGPLLSTLASGPLASVLHYARRRRTTATYYYARPKRPPTIPQRGRRRMYAYLASQWPLLTAAQRATWDLPDQATPLSPYHHYMAVNLHRHTTAKAPSKTYPPAESITPAAAETFAATGGVRMATVLIRQFAGTIPWGYMIYRGTASGFPLNSDTLILVAKCPGAGTLTYRDLDCPPGTWWYASARFSTDGKYAQNPNYRQVTVTD